MLLVIDNYDSFTWNLVHYLGELGAEPHVVRNEKNTANEALAEKPEAIVLSPGPCTPNEAGICLDLIAKANGEVPILGVCLGHQAIAEAYGGRVIRAPKLMHGKTSKIRHSGSDLFDGLDSPLEVMRYHSLTVEAESLPDELEILAWGLEDATEIHAMRHREHPVWGVQFHPESVMTQSGKQLLENFLRMSR